MNILQRPSPNYNKDRYIDPCMIVIHWTAGAFDPSVSWLCNPAAQVSAHYVISRYGDKIVQLVDMNRRGWHCNPSWHPIFIGKECKGINDHSIGIECEGPPSVLKWGESWNDLFIETLADLCAYIQMRIPAVKGITDHSTISPQLGKTDVRGGRGIDLFPWDALIRKTGMIDYATDAMRAEVRAHYGLKG